MHFGPAVVDNATKDIKIVFVVADHYYQQWHHHYVVSVDGLSCTLTK